MCDSAPTPGNFPSKLCTSLHQDVFITACLDASQINKQLTIFYKFLRGCVMGKYFLGWLLGIPVFVLVIIYLVFNH